MSASRRDSEHGVAKSDGTCGSDVRQIVGLRSCPATSRTASGDYALQHKLNATANGSADLMAHQIDASSDRGLEQDLGRRRQGPVRRATDRS